MNIRSFSLFSNSRIRKGQLKGPQRQHTFLHLNMLCQNVSLCICGKDHLSRRLLFHLHPFGHLHGGINSNGRNGDRPGKVSTVPAFSF